MGWFKEARERINVAFFDFRDVFFRIINILTVIAIIAGLIVVVRFIGFTNDEEASMSLINSLQRVLDYFVLRFVFRVFFDFNPLKFLKNHLWESIFMFFIFSESLIFFAFDTSYWFLLIKNFGIGVTGYFMFVQLLLWVVVFQETGRGTIGWPDFQISPAGILALSFLTMIIVGTLLLKMPEMTVASISWTDALFTSTSASCVTGLLVQDTATYFTFKGQLVIMLLFQLGGLNMLTFATFIGSFYHQSGSLRSINLMRDFLGADESGGMKRILQRVVYYSFAFELVGATFLYFFWGGDYHFHNVWDQIFFSLFHSISAFNNAGFSLLTNGLFEASVRFQYGAHLVIMILIIAGGLGFLVLQDLFTSEKWWQRKRNRWRKLMINTRLVLVVSGLLLVIGAVLFFVFEYNNTLKDHSLGGKIVASLFQSVTTRTAGFNTVDTSALALPTLLVFMLFMFIGANPGSTGGGIKTTTFAVAMQAAWANLRGKDHVEIFRRNIPWNYVNKTYAIIALAVSFLFFFTVLLSLTNPQFSLKEILFEQLSAMGTVGLTLGITDQLSQAGKLILVVSMFIGRIGSLSMAVILSRKVASKNYRYSDTRLMIG